MLVLKDQADKVHVWEACRVSENGLMDGRIARTGKPSHNALEYRIEVEIMY